MRGLHARLRASGFLVPYLHTYAGTGPHGTLRIAVSAMHTPADLDELAERLGACHPTA